MATDRHWRNVETYDVQDTGHATTTGPSATSYTEVASRPEQIRQPNGRDASPSLGGGVKNELRCRLRSQPHHVRQHEQFGNNAGSLERRTVDPYNPTAGIVHPCNPPGHGPRTRGIVTDSIAVCRGSTWRCRRSWPSIAGIRLDQPTLDRCNRTAPEAYVRKEFSHTRGVSARSTRPSRTWPSMASTRPASIPDRRRDHHLSAAKPTSGSTTGRQVRNRRQAVVLERARRVDASPHTTSRSRTCCRPIRTTG